MKFSFLICCLAIVFCKAKFYHSQLVSRYFNETQCLNNNDTCLFYLKASAIFPNVFEESTSLLNHFTSKYIFIFPDQISVFSDNNSQNDKPNPDDFLTNLPLSSMRTPCNEYKDICTLSEWKTLNMALWKYNFKPKEFLREKLGNRFWQDCLILFETVLNGEEEYNYICLEDKEKLSALKLILSTLISNLAIEREGPFLLISKEQNSKDFVDVRLRDKKLLINYTNSTKEPILKSEIFPPSLSRTNRSCLIIPDIQYDNLKTVSFLIKSLLCPCLNQTCNSTSLYLALEWVIDLNRLFYQSLRLRLTIEQKEMNIDNLINMFFTQILFQFKKNNLLSDYSDQSEKKFSLIAAVDELCSDNSLCRARGLNQILENRIKYNPKFNFKYSMHNLYLVKEIIEEANYKNDFVQKPSRFDLQKAMNTFNFFVDVRNITFNSTDMLNYKRELNFTNVSSVCLNKKDEFGLSLTRRLSILPLIYPGDIMTDFVQYAENYEEQKLKTKQPSKK